MWVERLLKKLDDQEADDPLAKILLGMIKPDPKKRWSADRCLTCGLQSGLFRVATDGRIVGVNDRNKKDPNDSDDGTKTPTARSPTASLSAARPGDLDPHYYKSVDATDLFGSHWLRDPNCVGSDVAALGDDVDEESSRLSNWTSVHSENSLSASATDVSNEQNSNQGSPLEGTEGTHPHNEDGRVRPQ